MTPVRPLTRAAARIPESPEVREMREAYAAGAWERRFTNGFVTVMAIAIIVLMVLQIWLVYR